MSDYEKNIYPQAFYCTVKSSIAVPTKGKTNKTQDHTVEYVFSFL